MKAMEFLFTAARPYASPRGRVCAHLLDCTRRFDNQRFGRVPIRMIPGDEVMLQQLAEVIERLRDLLDAGALAEVLA